MAFLEVQGGQNEGTRVHLGSVDRVSIGRAPTNHLRVLDPRASRVHCAVSHDRGRFNLIDLRSRNGTYLDGQRITGSVPMRPGQQIEIGAARICVVLEPGDPVVHELDETTRLEGLEYCELCAVEIEPTQVRMSNGKPHCPVCDLLGERRQLVDVDGTSIKAWRFGPFLVKNPLGSGAMGVVYRATDTRSNRQIALKLMLPQDEARPEAIARFRQEISVTSALDHHGIVRCIDCGAHDSGFYLAMELLDGASLQMLLRRSGRIPPALALPWASQLLEALTHAHERGVIHRDIKPGNIMVTATGSAVLLDFGLGRMIESSGTRLTQSAMIMGTANYMPPEQVMDTARVDHRADLYALGATLYLMLTGRHAYPFSGVASRDLLVVINTEPTPLRQAMPEVPKALAAIVDRALSADPDARHASAREMGEALSRVRADHPELATDTP